MTRTDLRTMVLSWLDDLQGAYFTPAQVNVWLNMAQRQVQMELLQAGENWYMKPVETLMVSGQQDYMFPSDFVYEHRIEIVLSGTGSNENRQPLIFITTNQQDQVPISIGVPSCYYIKKDRFTISPTPSTAMSNKTLRLYYSPRVADMTSDSDSPDVPEQFMEYVAILAAFNGFIKDDRGAENLLSKKTEYLNILKKMAEDRNQDAARQVVMVEDYDSAGGMWF